MKKKSIFVNLITFLIVPFILIILYQNIPQVLAQNCYSNDCSSWRCPGPNCDKCAVSPWYWWDDGCSNKPTQTGCCTPCGDFQRICAFNDIKLKCINGSNMQCGNDGCYHDQDPKQLCNQPSQNPTNLPSKSPTLFPTVPIILPTQTPSSNNNQNNPYPNADQAYDLFHSLLQLFSLPINYNSDNNSSNTATNSLPSISPTPTLSTTNNSQISGFVNQLRSNCKADNIIGRIDYTNKNCYQSIAKPPSSDNVVSYFDNSVDRYYYLQCVSFIWGLVSLEGSKYFACNVSAAKDCDASNSQGYLFLDKSAHAQVGDILVFFGGAYGHVAYVNSVNQDNNGAIYQYILSEANYVADGVVTNTRPISTDSINIKGILRKI